MKEYVCVELDHHEKIGKKIEEYQKRGWRFHTYQAAGLGMGAVAHYLLFEREVDS